MDLIILVHLYGAWYFQMQILYPFFLHILAVGLYNHFNYIKLNHIILGTKNEVLFYRFLIRWLHDFGEFDRMVH